MERVYKAGPRVANNLVKLSDSVSNQIFARYSPKTRARIAYSTISDAIIAVRMGLEWGKGLTIC